MDDYQIARLSAKDNGGVPEKQKFELFNDLLRF